MSLHPLRGHDAIRRALVRARLAGTLPSALLLHGPPGVGKQRLALWMAQLVLCDAPRADLGSCGECRHCRLAVRLEHPDLHWHFPLPRPRGASTPEKLADALEDARAAELAEIRSEPLRSTFSEDVRAHYLAAVQTLRRRAHRRPSMSDSQIFIIADAETLVPQESSPEAANSILKLLEEPPGGTRFILTSSEPGRLLPTIRSRCLPLHLAAVSTEEVERFLIEVAGAPEESAGRASRLAGGSIGRALGFLPRDGEPGPLEQLRKQALELVRASLGGRGDGFAAALGFAPAGARGLLDLFAFVEEWLRDIAAVAAGAPAAAVNADHAAELERLAAAVDAVDVARSLERVEEAREQARGNVNPQLIVSGLLSRLRRDLQPRGAA